MKEIAALVLLTVLVVVGWNQSYKNHFDSLAGNPPPATPAPVATPPPVAAGHPASAGPGATVPVPTPVPDKSWMWEKKPGTPPLSTPGKLGGKHGR